MQLQTVSWAGVRSLISLHPILADAKEALHKGLELVDGPCIEAEALVKVGSVVCGMRDRNLGCRAWGLLFRVQ